MWDIPTFHFSAANAMYKVFYLPQRAPCLTLFPIHQQPHKSVHTSVNTIENYTSPIDVITLSRQNIAILTQTYLPCQGFASCKWDCAFQLLHKQWLRARTVHYPPELWALFTHNVFRDFEFCSGLKVNCKSTRPKAIATRSILKAKRKQQK